MNIGERRLLDAALRRIEELELRVSGLEAARQARTLYRIPRFPAILREMGYLPPKAGRR